MPLNGRTQAIANLRKRQDQFCRAIALEALGRLVRRTPVDTGRARANWNTAVGAPDRSTDEGKTRADVQSTLAAGGSVIASFGAGDRLFVTNGLPYIPALEAGSSMQAPSGMVAITVAEMKQISARAAAKISIGF